MKLTNKTKQRTQENNITARNKTKQPTKQAKQTKKQTKTYVMFTLPADVRRKQIWTLVRYSCLLTAASLEDFLWPSKNNTSISIHDWAWFMQCNSYLALSPNESIFFLTYLCYWGLDGRWPCKSCTVGTPSCYSTRMLQLAKKRSFHLASSYFYSEKVVFMCYHIWHQYFQGFSMVLYFTHQVLQPETKLWRSQETVI